MTQRALDRLSQLAAADTRFSGRSAALTLSDSPHRPVPSARQGLDIAELLRRLEADAWWSQMANSTPAE